MIRSLAIVREAATVAAKAADGTTEALRDDRVEQEPAFTDRMLGRIEHAMDGLTTKGVRWTAKTLTDHGPGAQERDYGADFIGVLSIVIQGYRVTKGFLAQAKRVDALGRQSEVRRLLEQCQRMLDLSPASFVWLYSREGISVVPATAVTAAGGEDLEGLYSRSASRFFEEHFECFIGDPRIQAPNIRVLQGLRERIGARSLLYLGVGG
jgi:hypothetical protein